MGRLDGKIAIITGASQGMGSAHARAFVAEGAKKLSVNYVDLERHFPERDDGCGEMVECEEAALELFVAHE